MLSTESCLATMGGSRRNIATTMMKTISHVRPCLCIVLLQSIHRVHMGVGPNGPLESGFLQVSPGAGHSGRGRAKRLSDDHAKRLGRQARVAMVTAEVPDGHRKPGIIL